MIVNIGDKCETVDLVWFLFLGGGGSKMAVMILMNGKKLSYHIYLTLGKYVVE